MRTLSIALVTLAACDTAPAPSADTDPGAKSDLPGHSECLPVGEKMDEATCRAVIAEEGRVPNVSSDKSYAPPPDPDWRLEDPEYAWLLSEVERCTCVCCHNSDWDAPAVHRWDVAFEPMWIDSMSDWSLGVFVGETYSDDQFLPSSDPERLKAIVEGELERREAARDR